jgi:hypothetical protein
LRSSVRGWGVEDTRKEIEQGGCDEARDDYDPKDIER